MDEMPAQDPQADMRRLFAEFLTDLREVIRQEKLGEPSIAGLSASQADILTPLGLGSPQAFNNLSTQLAAQNTLEEIRDAVVRIQEIAEAWAAQNGGG